MGTSGDKIVLLDGMGSGSGSAANGLLSMIPGMFTSLLGGNKMDPNLVAALMNGLTTKTSSEGLTVGERGIRDEFDGTEPYMRRGRRSRYY